MSTPIMRCFTQRAFLSSLALGAGVLIAMPSHADDSMNTGYFGGVAIMGYDPVAYFTENQAVKGSEKISYEWMGTPWHFATSKHREMFMGQPIKYAPQYGGYCTGEVALGAVTINVDPEAFKIVDGKLYLGYSQAYIDYFVDHDKEEIDKANANWQKVSADLELDQYH